MILELFNALLYITTLLWYWRKYRMFDAYFVLILAYSFTAVVSYFWQMSGLSTYNDTNIFSYLYLYIVILIFFKPYQGFSLAGRIRFSENKTIKILTYIYLVSGIISIAYTLPQTIELIQSDDWGSLRNDLYADKDNIQLYGSQFERLAKNVSSYLGPFGTIMSFYYLSKGKKHIIITFLLFATWIGSSFVSATLVASRGMVVNVLLQVLTGFVLFKDVISKKVKRIFAISIGSIAGLSTLYLAAVSVSRFGEGDASQLSIFMYLGHAMQNFNENMMSTMHSFAGGKYFFSYFLNMFGIDPYFDRVALGYNGGSGFYTFVGSFYMDFGPIGTFIIALIICALLKSVMKKRVIKISDMIIITYFANFFMNGVFVIGPGAALLWFMMFVVYRIVKLSEIK